MKLEKISEWNLTKVRSKKQVIDEARTKGAKVHFASLIDICHRKNAELETNHQKYKGRVVLRGDIVDDSGSCAVFTEQGSSAAQMTAAKVMDIISRLPGCAGQAADAVSSYDVGEPTSFHDHVYLGCTQRQCKISKDIVDKYRAMFESRISAGWTEKTTKLVKSSYFLVVLRYGRSCQEMCGTILWVGKQDDSTTLQSIYSMHRWQSFQRGRIEICRRIVKGMPQIVLKCLYLARIGRPDILLLSEQTCTIDYEMDQSLWHDWIVWYLTSITHVNTNSIVMWVILQNNAGWDCFKTPILREILRTQNLLRVEHCVFLEVTHLFQKVGCARNKLPFRTVQQNQKSFLWMQGWR